jgi:hypothetical protein
MRLEVEEHKLSGQQTIKELILLDASEIMHMVSTCTLSTVRCRIRALALLWGGVRRGV